MRKPDIALTNDELAFQMGCKLVNLNLTSKDVKFMYWLFTTIQNDNNLNIKDVLKVFVQIQKDEYKNEKSSQETN